MSELIEKTKYGLVESFELGIKITRKGMIFLTILENTKLKDKEAKILASKIEDKLRERGL